MSAADQWRANTRAWVVPEEIQARSGEPRWSLDPEMFRWRPDVDAQQPVRPSRRRALEALPDGGSVLDVGVGGGASSLGLAPRVALITGVDPSAAMLQSFLASAEVAGVAARAVQGLWPDVAPEVEPADVAVCHHAVYGVAEIEPFVEKLTARARNRVVVEVSSAAPLAGINPLWRAFHGIERPERAVADGLADVLGAMAVGAEREDLVLPARPQDVTPALVAFVRRRLCVGPERDQEIEQFLCDRTPQDQRVVALWWPGSA